MVDPIGFKPATSVERRGIARVAPGASGAPTAHSTDAEAQAASSDSIANAARMMAASPPVDAERVARIRKAIADGGFPIQPARIADGMLALERNWNLDE